MGRFDCPRTPSKIGTTTNSPWMAFRELCSAAGILPRVFGRYIHAGTLCQEDERDKLERLRRYIARAPVANDRFSANERDQVIYKLKHPFRDGTTHVVLHPLDFIARLAALVPRPRTDLNIAKSALMRV